MITVKKPAAATKFEKGKTTQYQCSKLAQETLGFTDQIWTPFFRPLHFRHLTPPGGRDGASAEAPAVQQGFRMATCLEPSGIKFTRLLASGPLGTGRCPSPKLLAWSCKLSLSMPPVLTRSLVQTRLPPQKLPMPLQVRLQQFITP